LAYRKLALFGVAKVEATASTDPSSTDSHDLPPEHGETEYANAHQDGQHEETPAMANRAPAAKLSFARR
jgi:hypothetical protein